MVSQQNSLIWLLEISERTHTASGNLFALQVYLTPIHGRGGLHSKQQLWQNYHHYYQVSLCLHYSGVCTYLAYQAQVKPLLYMKLWDILIKHSWRAHCLSLNLWRSMVWGWHNHTKLSYRYIRWAQMWELPSSCLLVELACSRTLFCMGIPTC